MTRLTPLIFLLACSSEVGAPNPADAGSEQQYTRAECTEVCAHMTALRCPILGHETCISNCYRMFPHLDMVCALSFTECSDWDECVY